MKFLKVLLIVLEVLLVGIYAAGGIAVMIWKDRAGGYDGKILGMVIIICSVLRIIRFFVKKEYNEGSHIGLLAGIIGFSFGFIFYFSELEIWTMCVMWGVYEIAFAAYEVVNTVKVIREDKIFGTATLILSIGELVFGTLLCIHAAGGISVHFIFVGATLILTAVTILTSIIHRYLIKKALKQEQEAENKTDA